MASTLRYRLWEIDALINRAVVYSALTTALAGIYLGSVVLLQRVVRAVTGQRGTGVVTVLSTLIIAVLFSPLRRRLQGAIDRRYYRQKYNAVRTLAAFGAALREDVDLVVLTERLLETVIDAMQPAHVSVWLRHRDP